MSVIERCNMGPSCQASRCFRAEEQQRQIHVGFFNCVQRYCRGEDGEGGDTFGGSERKKKCGKTRVFLGAEM